MRAENQRQGIGSKLITFLKEHVKGLGYEEIFVQADIEDQHAIQFYEKTGGTKAQVVHFSYKV